MTRDIWERCRVKEKSIIFKSYHGLWGWVVKNRSPLLTNSASKDPRSAGIPEGHLPIHRFLSAPAMIGNELVGQIALANSAREYTEKDLTLIKRLADIYAIAVQRKRAEDALQRAHDDLEQRVQIRTTELSKANQKLRRQIFERKNAEIALRESEKELKLLSKQLLSAEENERKRIARELHDGIGQALSAIKFSVENSLITLRNDSSNVDLKILEAIIPMAQETIEDVRRIVQDLRPSILDDLGILATISWVIREFQTIYSKIHITKDITVKENEITVSLKTVIFRILQEALNNIAKHSRADSVRLCLNKSGERIYLIIEDNGKGFDVRQTFFAKPSKRGFGLASMRERAQLSEGTFDITSAYGQGTILSASWPL